MMSIQLFIFHGLQRFSSVLLLFISFGFAQSEIRSSLQLVVAARSGGEYSLAPGTYTLSDTLTINNNLVLIGAGEEKTIISIKKAPVGLRVTEDIDLRLEGIGFHYEGSEPGDILHLEAGRFEIVGCEFRGAIWGEAEGLKPYGYGSALYLSGQARGLVAESSFSGNQLAAIEIADSADLEFKNNVLDDNTLGLFAEGKNQLYLEGNVFSNHPGNAMQLRGNVTATILSTVFDTNGSVDTEGENSFDAVRISGMATVSFENSAFHNAPRFSLSLSNNATVNGKNNVFENNGGYYEALDLTFAAVLLEDESNINLTGDTLSNNPGGALELIGSAKANLSSVSIQGNGSWASIYATDSSELILRNSLVSNNEGYIYLTKDSKSTLENNEITDSADAGIYLYGFAQATLKGNTIARNTDFGVILGGAAQATLSQNSFYENLSGIGLFDSSSATISGNQINKHQRSGIAFLNDSSGSTSENSIRDNLWNGIVIGHKASARLESNLLENNVQRGILYNGAGTGSATGNTISGSKVGIHLGGEETPTLENNTFSNNEQDTYTGPLEE